MGAVGVSDGGAIGAARRACAGHHEALDAALSDFGWLASTDSYRTMLGRFAGLYLALEQPAHAALEDYAGGRATLDVRPARKLPLLRADLAALGMGPEAIAGLRRPGVADPAGTTAALGVLYVLEGATLGGKVIRQAAHRRLGAALPTAFFGAYGADAARRFRMFAAGVERVVPQDEAGTFAGAAAGAMRLSHRWLVDGDAR